MRHRGDRSGVMLRIRARPTEPFGVNAVSYWRSELGIADGARALVAALRAVELPVRPISLRSFTPPSRQQGDALSSGWPEDAGYSVTLLAFNPEGVLALRKEAGRGFFTGRANVGYWWWEVVGAFPASWRPAFRLVDEVFVGSRYVQDAIQSASPVPVRLAPIPVAPLPPSVARDRFGPPDGFQFLTVFDYNSTSARKNPQAVVRAYRDAFDPGEGASLVIKSINGDRAPGDRAQLVELTAGRPDIRLIEHYMSAHDVDQLLAGADCVVSLHRAEGFGIPLARALRSGIPVLATGYGGNLDFMSDENSYLVVHTLVAIPEGTLYPAGAQWAEPDVKDAARQMRRVFEHPDEARARARQGAAWLTENHSPEHTGATLREELERITAIQPKSRRSGRIRPGPR
jgi:glycosyltransferase involved in cell wall biosynthesis